MPTTTMLPQELLDEIVDILRDDRHALVALAGVSHCFRDRAQKHLFREITLCPTKKTPSRLLDLSPRVLSHVQRVRLVAGAVTTGKRVYVHEDPALTRVFQALCNVDDIELTHMVRMDRGLLSIISLPHVKSLSLNAVFLDSPSSLFTILSYFPSLASLRLIEVHAMCSFSDEFVVPPLSITELTVSAGMVSSSLGSFIFADPAHGWLSHLQKLNVHTYFVNELPTLSRLVNAFPELHSLTINDPLGDVSHPLTQERLSREMPCFALQRLRDLHICISGHDSGWLQWWASNIGKASALQLERLTFERAYPRLRCASLGRGSLRSEEVWSGLDDALKGISVLQAVTVMFSLSKEVQGYQSVQNDVENVTKMIWESCPQLVRRGLLSSDVRELIEIEVRKIRIII